MFLVEKSHITSHFKSISKKSSPSTTKTYQLSAQSFDEKVKFHLKSLTPATDSSFISLSWMSKAVTALSMIHSEAQDQITNLGSESDYYQTLYMDYSLKVLDLCNLISSAVQQLTERRLLMKLSLRLLSSSGQIPAPEKLKKAKDALIRSGQQPRDTSTDKAQRAKDLIGELTSGINGLPIGKISHARDLIRRTLHALGVVTVVVTGVLVSVLYGESDLVELRVPTEFSWSDSVNAVQKQISDLIKPNHVSAGRLSELHGTASRAVAVSDILDEVVVSGDGDGGEKHRVELENGVKELGKTVAKFSDGIDELTNGVNGLFNSVLKTRNGVLDGVRKGVW